MTLAQLKKFCVGGNRMTRRPDAWDHLAWLRKPWSFEGWTCASDRRVLVRVSRIKGAPLCPAEHRKNVAAVLSRIVIPKGAKTVPLTFYRKITAQNRCVGASTFSEKYIRLLARLPRPVEILPPMEGGEPLFFRFRDGEGTLMPFNYRL